MVWAFRIASWLISVTAPYIWTVGQAGLETVNKNLCDLVTAIASTPTCQMHYLYVGVWVVGLSTSIVFILCDLARFVRRAAVQSGGVVPFYRRNQTVASSHVKRTSSKLEPSHIIFLGAAIAIIGAVWQLHRQIHLDDTKIIPQSQSQEEGTKRHLAEDTSSPPPVPTSSPSPVPNNPQQMRSGAAVHISPNARDSGIENVIIRGFDNGVLDEGKGSRLKNLEITK